MHYFSHNLSHWVCSINRLVRSRLTTELRQKRELLMPGGFKIWSDRYMTSSVFSHAFIFNKGHILLWKTIKSMLSFMVLKTIKYIINQLNRLKSMVNQLNRLKSCVIHRWMLSLSVINPSQLNDRAISWIKIIDWKLFIHRFKSPALDFFQIYLNLMRLTESCFYIGLKVPLSIFFKYISTWWDLRLTESCFYIGLIVLLWIFFKYICTWLEKL